MKVKWILDFALLHITKHLYLIVWNIIMQLASNYTAWSLITIMLVYESLDNWNILKDEEFFEANN